MVEKEVKLKDDMIEDEDEGDEDQPETMTPEQLADMLLKACKENNIEDVQFCLQNNAPPNVEKEGWNPLLWGACNGNEQIVRLLIKHNACAPYLNQNQDELAMAAAQKNIQPGVGGEEVYDPFVKPKDA